MVGQELAPTEVWDIDTPDQLLAWQLQSSAAVSSILELIAARQARIDRPVVIATTAQAVQANQSRDRSRPAIGGAVIEGDDFYRAMLPKLSVAQRDEMSDAAVVDAVIDWDRLRDKALLPLRSRQPATFQPYDWDAMTRPAGTLKTIPAANVIILDGVYVARPELADLVDVAIYLGVDPQTRARRYLERHNDPDWVRLWSVARLITSASVPLPASTSS